MEYYQNLRVNLRENNINYFEWNSFDKTTTIKNLPLITISKKDFLNIYQYNFILKEDTLKQYKYIIFSDKSNTIVIELSNNKSVKRSNISYTDDEIICELLYNQKIKRIKYELLEKVENESNYRLESTKKMLIKSINNLEDIKLKYIYFELTNKYEDNNKTISSTLIKFINTLQLDTYIKYQDILDELIKNKCPY